MKWLIINNMHVFEIKKEARERFALNRYHAMLVYGVVYTLALNIAVLTTLLFIVNKWAVWYGVILIFLFLLMLAPFGFGMTGFYLKSYRYEKIDAFHIFDGFNKYNLERVIILRLLKFALWLAFTILLIVPGIIFSLRTSMATYILRANPEMKPQEALKESNKIMKGHCAKYFGLTLSFLGWYLMGVLTCGFGFIWVMPYFNTAKIVLYKREIQGDKTVFNKPETSDTDLQPSQTEEECDDSEEEILCRKIAEEISSMDAILGKSNESADVSNGAATESETVDSSEPDYGAPVYYGDTPTENGVNFYGSPITEEQSSNGEPSPIVIANGALDNDAESVVSQGGELRDARREAVHKDGLRRAERRPLPGGRVTTDADGNRRVIRPSVTDSAPMRGSRRAESGEKDESAQSRLDRIRSERSSRREQRVSAARRADGKTIEINEDDE